MGEKNRVYNQIGKNEVIVECAICNKSGKANPKEAWSGPCWVCRGKGIVLIQADRLPLYVCARCNGSGRSFPEQDNFLQCLVCKGTGHVAVAGTFKIIR